MLRLSSGKLATLNTGFSAQFQQGRMVADKDATYKRVATVVPSSTREQEYGWLRDIPQIREWIGDRHINSLMDDGYKIKNRKYELTIGVKGDDIDDDNVGIYAPRFEMMGDEVARFPDRLVYELLNSGFVTKCFDGQPFIDANHPYIAKDGTTATQSNYQSGGGTPWYLLCTKRPLKPLIYQERRPFDFTSLDKPNDENVFMRDELLYGVDGRANVGFGFWQMAVGSKAALDDTNFKAARQMMLNFTGDQGKPLGLMPDLWVGPPSLLDAATELFKVPTRAGGAGNPLFEAVEVLVTPFLA